MPFSHRVPVPAVVDAHVEVVEIANSAIPFAAQMTTQPGQC